jgi:hypothetical protein
MARYEISNPSDECYIEGDDVKTVCIATIILGNGYYGLTEVDGEFSMPPPIFATGWFKSEFGEDISVDLLLTVDQAALKAAMLTVELADERTSMNDIVGRARAWAERL